MSPSHYRALTATPENSPCTLQSDCWTKIATIGECITSFISNTYWLGQAIDLSFGLEPYFAEISIPGFVAGVTAATFVTLGATYSHYKLNITHQPDNKIRLLSYTDLTKINSDTEPQESRAQSILKKLAVVGDFISHTGDSASIPIFVTNLATKNSLSRSSQALLQCGSTLFGACCAIAQARVCKQHVLESPGQTPLSSTHVSPINSV